jgi:hypothetical protein
VNIDSRGTIYVLVGGVFVHPELVPLIHRGEWFITGKNGGKEKERREKVY